MVMRPTRKQYPTYPNYDFLQLEEINQTIYNFCPDDFHEWYCLDTAQIVKIYDDIADEDGVVNVSFRDYRYDFIIVSLDYNKDTGVYKWTFEVRNILWNGNYIIKYPDPDTIKNLHARPLDNDEEDGEYNTLIISGTDLYHLIVCFELTNDGERVIPEQGSDSYVSIEFTGTYSYTHQYDLANKEKCKIINSLTKEPVEGVKVRLVPCTSDGLEVSGDNYLTKQDAVTTNSNGTASITYSKTKSKGTYYAMLYAEYDYPCTNGDHSKHTAKANQLVTVEKFEAYNPSLNELSNTEMYKGGYGNFVWNINLVTSYGASKKYSGDGLLVNIYHTYDSSYNYPLATPTVSKMVTTQQTVTSDKEGYIRFTLDGTKFYGDSSTVKINIPAQQGYEAVTVSDIKISHVWYYCESWDKLAIASPSEDAPNALVLKQGEHTPPDYTHNEHTDHDDITIYANRRLYILGEKGTSWPTLNGKGTKTCIKIRYPPNESAHTDVDMMIVIKGIKFINCDVAISQEFEDSRLSINYCCFVNNKNNSYNGVGTCVNQVKDGKLAVHNSYFYNNYGNTIHAKDSTLIEGNLFKIDNWKYPVQPHPYCLEQESGIGTVKSNQFYICPSMYWENGVKRFHYVDKNKSYAKIAVWVGKNATVNGKQPKDLKNDGTFNYFSSPYNNRSYTFAAYRQYKGNDRPTILCAPNSRIHTSCGHASAGWNPKGSKESRCPGWSSWAYWDGYQIWYLNGRNEAAVRNSGRNLNNPYITIKNGKVVEDTRIIVPSKGGVVD